MLDIELNFHVDLLNFDLNSTLFSVTPLPSHFTLENVSLSYILLNGHPLVISQNFWPMLFSNRAYIVIKKFLNLTSLKLWRHL